MPAKQLALGWGHLTPPQGAVMMTGMTAAIVYTVGHSNHAIENFLALLRRHGIRRLVDVRSVPYSRWVPHFRKRALSAALESNGIDYQFLGDALGGRPPGDEFYAADGTLDCARRSQAADFLAGIDRLLTLAAERPTAVMCAEEDPARCHRRALIAPALRARGVQIVHVRGDGRAQPEAVDRELDGQLSLPL